MDCVTDMVIQFSSLINAAALDEIAPYKRKTKLRDKNFTFALVKIES